MQFDQPGLDAKLHLNVRTSVSAIVYRPARNQIRCTRESAAERATKVAPQLLPYPKISTAKLERKKLAKERESPRKQL